MDYMIIVGALAAVAVILLIIIIAIFKSGRNAAEEYNRQIRHAAKKGADYDDGSGRRPVRARKAPVQEEDEEDEEDDEDDEEEVVVRRPVKKQWKILMENLDTWEKYTFIFYDNIGIGRKREGSEFEKYLVVRDDARVSKLHCAIISNGGRLYLKDMESRNGTYLNGELIEKPIVIQKEDVIGVGETNIEIKKILRERD
ncbi:MAG: FHA domain-containing protein [Ruminococcus sp.]|nr:FHA domain-containing protein [Ruminococcus sp.]